MKKLFGVLITLSAVALGFIACNKSASKDDAATQQNLQALFSQYLAEDMTVASPTAQKSQAGLLTLSENQSFTVPEGSATTEEKKEALETLLAADATSCNISINLASSGRANCYGPSVNYTSHETGNGNGSWPGGDLGIWEASEATQEACAAAQLNQRIKGAASLSDLGTFVVAGMACVANKNDKAMPAAGESIDLTSLMANVVTVNGQVVTIGTATLSRMADDSSGNPVRVATLEATNGTTKYTIRLKHVSLNSDDTLYRGKISVVVGKNTGTKEQNCNQSSATGNTDAVSVSYEKSSTTAAKLELKSANFCGYDADPFVSASNFSVDLSKSFANPSVPKGWANDANYFLASFDPSTNAGSFYYAWQAGMGDSHTRTFNAKIEGTTSKTGTAYFGYGPTMQTGPGAITGMICAWTGPDQNHTPLNYAQRQDMETNANGLFTSVSATTKITYDPVVDCEAAGSMSMSWENGTKTRAASSTTMDLVSVSEVATTIGTKPASPTEVD